MAIDRTQWQQHNVFMASVIWGKHALPLCFEQIDHRGNSDWLNSCFGEVARPESPALA